MRLSEAVDRADAIRPNPILIEEKRNWLRQLESDIAEMMETDLPEWTMTDDPELLLPEPKDYLYPLYLLPYIDLWLEETDLYQLDIIQANQSITEIKAWWRRNNRSQKKQYKGVFQ